MRIDVAMGAGGAGGGDRDRDCEFSGGDCIGQLGGGDAVLPGSDVPAGYGRDVDAPGMATWSDTRAIGPYCIWLHLSRTGRRHVDGAIASDAAAEDGQGRSSGSSDTTRRDLQTASPA